MSTMIKLHKDGTQDYGHLDDEGDRAMNTLSDSIKKNGLFGGGKESPEELRALATVKAQNAKALSGTGSLFEPAVAMSNSAQVVARALQNVKGNGVKVLNSDGTLKTTMEQAIDGPDEDELPKTPGFAYLTHLFNAKGAAKKLKERHQKTVTKGMNLLTNAPDGVKTALRMLGVAAETNLDGLPFDMKDVFKLFYGDKELDDIEKSDFMRELQDGVNKIDRKKVRKFVNHDGSLTWEILNDDKSIMSRFTYGEYNGKKLFAQGGYKNFAELLRQARAQLGDDYKGEFDAIRGNYKG